MLIRPNYQNYNLLIGSAFHKALEIWYKFPHRPMHRIARKIFEQLKKDIMATQNFYDSSDWDKASQLLHVFTGMCLGYAAHYKNERKKFRKIEVEKNFRIEFENFDYEGQVDMLYSTKYKRFLETKTASFVTNVYIKRLEMDNQIRGYWLGLKEGHDYTPKSCTYNVIRKAQLRRKSGETPDEFNERIELDYLERPDHYFHREKIVIRKDDLERFVDNLHIADAEYQYILNNYDPTIPEAWGTNDKHCDAYFKLCEYFELCTGGLDYTTEGMFDQRTTAHSELEDA